MTKIYSYQLDEISKDLEENKIPDQGHRTS